MRTAKIGPDLRLLTLLKHVSLKFPAFLDDSFSEKVALSQVILSIHFLMITFR